MLVLFNSTGKVFYHQARDLGLKKFCLHQKLIAILVIIIITNCFHNQLVIILSTPRQGFFLTEINKLIISYCFFKKN